MYVRFFRWATDRLDENGVLTLVTNRSFLDSRSFDGFRKTVAQEFNEIRIVDLGGDVRENPKLSGSKHNVFGIQTGVAITFMVKGAKQKGCRMFYLRRPEFENAEEKLEFLGGAKFAQERFEEIRPDKKHNWIQIEDNDFDSFLPLIDKSTRATSKQINERAIFKLFSIGIKTQRDEWVYDVSREMLRRKIRSLIEEYERARCGEEPKLQIKWDPELEKYKNRNIHKAFNDGAVVLSHYRPFYKLWFYFDRHFNGRTYQWGSIPIEHTVDNRLILYTQPGSQKPFMVGATVSVCDGHFVGAGAATECLPFFRKYNGGSKVENITDWALEEFIENILLVVLKSKNSLRRN